MMICWIWLWILAVSGHLPDYYRLASLPDTNQTPSDLQYSSRTRTSRDGILGGGSFPGGGSPDTLGDTLGGVPGGVPPRAPRGGGAVRQPTGAAMIKVWGALRSALRSALRPYLYQAYLRSQQSFRCITPKTLISVPPRGNLSAPGPQKSPKNTPGTPRKQHPQSLDSSTMYSRTIE